MSLLSVRLEDLGIEDLTEETLYPQVRTKSLALFALRQIRLIHWQFDLLAIRALFSFYQG